MKRVMVLLMVIAVMFLGGPQVVFADIFGSQISAKVMATTPPNQTATAIGPGQIIDELTKIVNYLGVREGTAYFWAKNGSGMCNYAAATLYTYKPWGLAADIGLLNIDGGALTIDWNIGAVIPSDQVPILNLFKYSYIGGGIGARYIDVNDQGTKWNVGGIVDAQFKFAL